MNKENKKLTENEQSKRSYKLLLTGDCFCKGDCKDFLEKTLGFTVYFAPDLEEGLWAIDQDGSYDAIIMNVEDYRRKVNDTTEIIRKFYKKPIIAYPKYAWIGDIRQHFDAGMTAVLEQTHPMCENHLAHLLADLGVIPPDPSVLKGLNFSRVIPSFCVAEH